MTAELNFKTSMAFAYGVAAEVAPGVARIVAPNAGPLTFKGTNTYLVGSKSLAVIDPGPDDESHAAAILATAGGRQITHIFLTHAHRDHVDGMARLKDATGAITCGFGRTRPHVTGPDQTPLGIDFIDYGFVPEHRLQHSETVAGPDWELEAIYTPGHAPDHLSFAVAGSGAVISGDHVMAWNTTVIAPPEGHMGDYLSSLELLLDRPADVFLPGHGGRLYEPQRTVKAYLLHRRWREQAILGAIRGGATTVRDILPLVYKDLAPHLTRAAELSVLAHVHLLMEKRMVAGDAAATVESAFSAF